MINVFYPRNSASALADSSGVLSSSSSALSNPTDQVSAPGQRHTMKFTTYALVLIALASAAFAPALALAHHAYRVAYDVSRTESLVGQVVRLELVNPHAKLFVDVTNEDGDVVQWIVEGPGKLSLARRGWTDDTFVAGETISAVGNPSSAGYNAMWLLRIVKSDGTELMDPLTADALAIEEERRERIRQATQ